MRCFVGIFLPSDIKNNIVTIQNQLKKLPMKCKFVEKNNLHICLSFLGEIKEEKIKSICEKLKNVCRKYSKFNVKISGIKLIPSETFIRVIVLDIKNETLENLRKDVKNEIGGDSKPSHITLCRVKKIENRKNIVEKIREINYNIGSFVISKVSLIKSTLSRSGPTYETLFEIDLEKLL